jgi:hypothetical protein
MRHTIRKQIIELALPRGTDAFALQQRVSDRFYLDVLPELEKQFDAFSMPDHTISIEVLEIDLGTITEEMIDSGSWVIPFREALEKKLQETLREVAGQEVGSIEPLFETSFRHWFYFVRHGHLRWDSPRPSTDWLDLVLEAMAKNYQRTVQVRDILLKDRSAVKRIVLHHSDTFLSHLVELLTAEKQNELPAAIRQIAVALLVKNTGFPRAEIQTKLWMVVLQKVAREEPKQDTENIRQFLQKDWVPIIPEVNSPENMNRQADPLQEITEGQQNVTARFSEGKAEDADAFASDPETAIGEGIYINHAGLVLLHPFLATFFRKLGITLNGGFPDSVAQERAVCLLHLLVFPDAPVQEYDLVLPKLLCGWSLQKPVNTAIDFTPEEKNEAQQLLEAVVEQWEVLKNTSPIALQETFLQRDGKLFCQDEKWYLQVEKKPYDILLSRLPWTIGMVKLPWMKDLLRVEWL